MQYGEKWEATEAVNTPYLKKIGKTSITELL